MHTTEVIFDGQTFFCHHNGDFSGDVLIAADETSHECGILTGQVR